MFLMLLTHVCERGSSSYIGAHQHVKRDGTELHQDTMLPGLIRGLERERFHNKSLVLQGLLSLHFDEDL